MCICVQKQEPLRPIVTQTSQNFTQASSNDRSGCSGWVLWCCVTLICFCHVVWSLMFVFLEGTLWNCCGERLCQECRVHLDCFSDCSLVDVVMDMLYVRSAPSILRFILTDGSNSRAPPFSSKWVTEEQKLGQYDTKVQSVCNSFRFGEKTEVQCPD